MAGFTRGFIFGALTGTVFALLTSAKTGKQRQKAVKDWTTDTVSDIQKLQDAGKRLQESSAHLQTAMHENLEPALDGINQAVSHLEFRTAPHLANIEASLGKITAAMPTAPTANVSEQTPTSTDSTKQ